MQHACCAKSETRISLRRLSKFKDNSFMKKEDSNLYLPISGSVFASLWLRSSIHVYCVQSNVIIVLSFNSSAQQMIEKS